MGETLAILATLLYWLLTIALVLVFIRVLISWFSPSPYNPLVRFLSTSTDPMLRPLAQRIPAMGGLDWSPLILILGLVFLRTFIAGSLRAYSLVLLGKATGGSLIPVAYFLLGIAEIALGLLFFALLLLVIRLVVSLFSPDPYNPLVRFLYVSTDPLIRPVRKRVPPLGRFDCSLVLLVVVLYVMYLLFQKLALFAVSLGPKVAAPFF